MFNLIDKLKTKYHNFFANNTQQEVEDYTSKLTKTPEMYHLFIYKNEGLLKLDKLGNYLWYLCWNKNDSSTPVHFIEFLQFVNSEASCMRVYVVLDKIHVLMSLDVDDMSTIYENYINYGVYLKRWYISGRPNIFINALLEDISLDIPQSYIQGILNKAIKYHRTTLDGELDDDFHEVKKQSKFPLQLQESNDHKQRAILEADSIYDIRNSIRYISIPLTTFVSDEELLRFGRILLNINNVRITVTLNQVFDELPRTILDESLMTQDELQDFMIDLSKVCGSNDIPLVVLDPPESDIIYPEDSNEEIIEKQEITITNKDLNRKES